jgi:HSP90 family molecular chaperone
MYFEPLQYGSGMQQIVTDEIYDNPMVGIREMISNARD